MLFLINIIIIIIIIMHRRYVRNASTAHIKPLEHWTASSDLPSCPHVRVFQWTCI